MVVWGAHAFCVRARASSRLRTLPGTLIHDRSRTEEDRFEKPRSVAGVLRFVTGSGAPPGAAYAGNTVERVTSLSMVCSRTFSTVAPTFDPSRSTIQTCWPCSNEPRVITLSKTPSSVAGFLSTSTQIASVSPKSPSSLSLSSIFGFFIGRQAVRGAKLNRCSRFLRACPRS